MIIPLITSIYDPDTPFADDSAFYHKAMEDIAFFSLEPQIYSLLLQQGKLSDTPPFFQERLKQGFNKALYLNLFIKNQMEKILRALDGFRIPVIPLKGVQFAEKYFGHFGARGTSDIDLLVKHTDLEKTIDCVKALGFTVEEERIPDHFHYSFSKPIPGSPIPLTIEIHWDLLKENTSHLQIQEFWEKAIPLEPYHSIRELSPYHTFYMICLHGWKHNLNSLKYFLDILQIIQVHGHQLDYTTLFQNAKSHQTLKRIIRTLAIVYDLFPYLEKVKPLPISMKQRRNLWWEYDAIRDHNYKTYRQYINLFCFTVLDFDSPRHVLSALRNWLFPTKVDMVNELGAGHKTDFLMVQLYRKRFIHFFQTILHL